MNIYVELDNKVAFHLGYYIQEYLNEQNLSQEEFSKRYNTPLEVINGEQSISIDIAKMLSNIVGTSVEYWLNLQKEYDKLVCESKKISKYYL